MGEPERAISRLGLPENLVEFFDKEWGITTLYPPQAEAMTSVLSGRNTMVCIPTASGKSLVAFMGIVHQIKVKDVGSRGIYIVPLKALASEKQNELKQLGEYLGLKIGLGIGDAPNEAKQIGDCDILVCTSEKLDSLMRSRP